jgi:hypothetical protein
LPDFDDVTVRIADVASDLTVLVDRFGQKRRSPASPELVARLNVGYADIHEAADLIGVRRSPERYGRFVGCWTSPNVDDEPRVCDSDIGRCIPIASAHDFSSEDLLVEFDGSFDVGQVRKCAMVNPCCGGI